MKVEIVFRKAPCQTESTQDNQELNSVAASC